MGILWIIMAIVIIGFFLSGIRIIRPTHRGVIEFLGKYQKFGEPGFHWVIPFVQKMYTVNVTEQMVDAKKQEIITDDNLNATVDAQVYFRVKTDEENVKASLYNVYDCRSQIVNLARTTLRNIIGTMTLKNSNSERGEINRKLQDTLIVETKNWGIEIVRTELKEIEPPADVQSAMNQVVIASNEKTAAVDFATAAETKADGEKRAAIKKAEGDRQARILNAEGERQAKIEVAEGDRRARILNAEGERQAKIEVAEGEAKAIETVNAAADKFFIGNAQQLRKIQAVETAMQNSSKIVIPDGKELINVIGDLGGLTPVTVTKKKQ